MGQPAIQTSFNAGEWASALNARVDLAKYHSGASLLRNMFVDYRGGATTRAGLRYVAKSQNNGSNPPRLIPFQASFTVSYMLEFGTLSGVGYVGFINNGAQVLSGGVPYTIPSPYTSAELYQIKFAQNVNQLILCHPNHPPYVLTLISATNWTLVPIVIGTTVGTPTSPIVNTTLAGGTVYNYAYVITAVDSHGQESQPSVYGVLANSQDLRTVAGSNTITWNAVTGAVSYNVYKAIICNGAPVPAGAAFGFIGICTSPKFIDSNIVADFSQGPPVPQNPFFGTGVQSVTVTSGGSIVNELVPTVAFSGGGG